MNKVVQRASAKSEIPTLTEVGVTLQNLSDRPHFFAQEILNTVTSLDASLAYMLTWNNQFLSKTHINIFNPYPGHPNAQDYKDFYNDNRTFILSATKTSYPQLFQ